MKSSTQLYVCVSHCSEADSLVSTAHRCSCVLSIETDGRSRGWWQRAPCRDQRAFSLPAGRAADRASPSRGSRRGNRAVAPPATRPRAARRSPARSRCIAGRCRTRPSDPRGRAPRSARRSRRAGCCTAPGIVPRSTYTGSRQSRIGRPARRCSITSSSPTVRTPGSEADRLDHAPGRVNGEDPRLALDRARDALGI